MCSQLGRKKYFFEVSKQDDEYFYVIPGSCVYVEEGTKRLTPSHRTTKFVATFVRDITMLELIQYDTCKAI